ncbi:MAG TPA: VOC family protein [Acidimicrobiales bacterium]|nr:VOC family protein [Acidimicrobiales bacterium]
MPTLAGYSHLSLSVTDLERSTEWYCQVLGFEVVANVEGDGFQRNRLHQPDAGITLTLTAHTAGGGDTFDERRTGMDHVSFVVPSVDDIHDFKQCFQDLGVEHSDVKPTAGGAGGMITFRDPDNIQLEVFAAG